jgi:Ca2+ transporting ATPase
VLDYHQVDANRGLSEKTNHIEKLRLRFGANEMLEEKGQNFIKLILKQFDDLLVKILIVAAIVSFILAAVDGDGELAFVEPTVIVLILIANATVGVVTETNAEKAIEELKAYQADLATVLRDGRLRVVKASALVPGDIIELAVGAKVPADCRIIGILSSTLRVDQAILTGESGSVEKEAGHIEDSERARRAVVQDKTCLLFSGTVVSVGRARAVVVGTGLNTAIGKIRDAMKNHGGGDDEEELTPLKKKLDEFGRLLSKVIAVVCILVWVVNIGHFGDPLYGGWFRGMVYYLKIAVALAVAAIPEGLPAVVTTCLALGTRKMAKRHAIVRSLPSVETLGCTTVVCSDKTGTLTTNAMCVQKICVVDRTKQRSSSSRNGGSSANAGSSTSLLREFDVEGNSYAPNGLILEASNGVISPRQQRFNPINKDVVKHPADLPSVLHLSICASLCNDSTLTFDLNKREFVKIGESTEVALRVLSEKIGLPGFDAMPSALTKLSEQERASYCAAYWAGQFKRVEQLDFTRDRKMMSTLCSRKGTNILFSKGAPEAVLAKCTNALTNAKGAAEPMNDQVRKDLNDVLAKYAKTSLRVLALAMRPMPAKQTQIDAEDENDLTFLGFVGIADPPRAEVARAIATCRGAGIRVVMVTGDNKTTAESIGAQIGLIEADAFGEPIVPDGASLQGIDFEELKSEREKSEAVTRLSIFSRVEPAHKAKLVELLKNQKHVVAMTGDGVNDAPALKRADIGVSMGSGTEVAKHASDMVLADDNFATIVSAVAEGRAIYDNTKAFIRYMVSSNIGEVVCIFIAAALGMPETLCPVQLLWVNLVTDGLPATALGFNKPDRDIMRQRPRSPTEPIVDSWLFIRYLIVGVYVGIVTVVAFAWWFMYFENGPLLSWSDLTSFEQCVEGAHDYSCQIFKDRRPSTMSMTVLVTVEMFNALNALSENSSLLKHPPWSNKWLLGAIFISMALHAMILYVPWMNITFSVSYLSWQEWKAVLWLSFPVIVCDEILKALTRKFKKRGRYFGRLGFGSSRKADLLPTRHGIGAAIISGSSPKFHNQLSPHTM